MGQIQNERHRENGKRSSTFHAVQVIIKYIEVSSQICRMPYLRQSLLCASVCPMGAWNEREAKRSCSLLHPERRGYDSSKRGRCAARGGLDQYVATKDSRLPNASGELRCRLGNSSHISFDSITLYCPI